MIKSRLLAAVLLLGVCLPRVNAVTGKINNFDPPGSIQTVPLAINSTGTITGWYSTGSSKYHGFLRDNLGNITVIDAPGAANVTLPYAINDSGSIVGQYVDDATAQHSFLRDSAGGFQGE